MRGWCSLDFMRDGDTIVVLEVNPRPPASLSLYAQPGLIDAQLRACLHAELPPRAAFASSSRPAVPLFRSQSLTTPLRSHDASRVPPGWNATL